MYPVPQQTRPSPCYLFKIELDRVTRTVALVVHLSSTLEVEEPKGWRKFPLKLPQVTRATASTRLSTCIYRVTQTNYHCAYSVSSVCVSVYPTLNEKSTTVARDYDGVLKPNKNCHFGVA